MRRRLGPVRFPERPAPVQEHQVGVTHLVDPRFLPLAALAVLFWFASELAAGTEQQVIFSSLSVAATGWAGAILTTDRGHPRSFLFRLGPAMLAYGGITFGIASITAWTAPESLSSQLRLETFRSGQALVIVAFVAFLAGYLLTPRAGMYRILDGAIGAVRRRAGNRDASPSRCITAYVLGLGALIIGAALSGSYGYLGDAEIRSATDVAWYTMPLSILSSIRVFAIFAAWVPVFQRKAPGRFLIASTITVTDLALSLFSGMKEVTLVTILAVVFAFTYSKRRMPLAVLAIAAATFTFILSPLVNSIRELVRGGGTLTLSEAFAASRSVISEGGAGSAADVWYTLSRFRLVDNVALINAMTPTQIPFRPAWELVESAASGFVPRAFWPDKPIRLDGVSFYQQYYGGTTYSSSAVTIPGSLYMYGGIVVLVIGMALFGLLTRSMDDAMCADRSQVGMLLLLALFPQFVKMEVSAPTLLASLPIVAVGWWIASRVLFYQHALPASVVASAAEVEAPKRARRSSYSQLSRR